MSYIPEEILIYILSFLKDKVKFNLVSKGFNKILEKYDFCHKCSLIKSGKFPDSCGICFAGMCKLCQEPSCDLCGKIYKFGTDIMEILPYAGPFASDSYIDNAVFRQYGGKDEFIKIINNSIEGLKGYKLKAVIDGMTNDSCFMVKSDTSIKTLSEYISKGLDWLMKFSESIKISLNLVKINVNEKVIQYKILK